MNSLPIFHLKLFGSPSLEGDDKAVLGGRATQRHRLALLALLAVAGDRRLTREKLIAYLWPEAEPERGRNNLNVSTYVLRTALGDSAFLSAGEDVRLNPEVVHSDVAEFEGALERADHAGAVALYRGPFLDGFFLPDAPEFDEWANGERQRLAGGYAKALEALATAAEADRDFQRAVELWKTRAGQDLYDSRVALRLMLALEASGNRAAALQHAAIHQRLLEEELGIAATPEIAALVERLRRQPISETPGLSAHAEPPADRKVEPPANSSSATAGDLPAGRRRRWAPAAALLAVISVIGIAWVIGPDGPEPERSIVVLPFTNMSGQPDNDYFSDGLTEEIITRLSAVPTLKVISRTSAMHYKGSKQTMPQIAEQLNVAHILQGSVRRSEGRVRISVQLLDARGDENLWADNYDGNLVDVIRVQEEIAREVVRALEVKLGEREQTALMKKGTRDPEAYELYRRGRFLWRARTKDGNERATEYYRRAIERDSTYSDAYAGLADTYLTNYQFNLSSESEAEIYSRVKWAAERALALDDQSTDAHTSFAVSLWWQGNWPGAERELRRALELNHGNATAHAWYSLLLAGFGRTEEALREVRRANELDPFNFLITATYGQQCYIARVYDCAIEQYVSALEMNPFWTPARSGLGMVYAQKGMFEQALVEANKAVEVSDTPNRLADLAYVQARRGETRAALDNLSRAKKKPGEAFHIARAYVALGERDSAFAWLERSSWRWPHRAVRGDPALDPLRSDPRFARLATRIDREMGIR
jgi:TolB-like protein/DNA-binding SARP family transcriptional activator/Flp pilus assembly protein TadD